MLSQEQRYNNLGFKVFMPQKARQEYVVDKNEDTTVDDDGKPSYDHVRLF